jgi:hypothetical protein
MSDLSPGTRVGEKRTISGVLHEWTGAVWRPIIGYPTRDDSNVPYKRLPPLDADSRFE